MENVLLFNSIYDDAIRMHNKRENYIRIKKRRIWRNTYITFRFRKYFIQKTASIVLDHNIARVTVYFDT